MMVTHPAAARGHTRLDWLESHHSFSFGDFYDPARTGVANLRVINEDLIAPGGGFPTHGHSDMEIVTYVLEGALEHRDSLGHGAVMRPGDVQRMSAGSGIRHSEYNASGEEPVHLLQIWLLPDRKGVESGYAQRHYSTVRRRGRWCLLVSPDAREGSLGSHQGGLIYGALLEPGESLSHTAETGRCLYLHLATGVVEANGQRLAAGDAATLEAGERLAVSAQEPANLLLFDLPV